MIEVRYLCATESDLRPSDDKSVASVTYSLRKRMKLNLRFLIGARFVFKSLSYCTRYQKEIFIVL